MFLRRHARSKDGKEHAYWSLVETVRTPDGPRQRTLCYLGELNDSARARWLKTIEVFNAQGESRQLKLFPSDIEPPADDATVARVQLDQVRLERARRFGDCFLGLELWKRLGLDRFWEALLDRPEDPAEVPWSRVAALLAINRLCAPGSELAIEERWYPATALDDLLGIASGKINDTRLYRSLDRLLPHKRKLERHLKERYGELFGAEFDVLLYDLTSSYVEGAAEKDPMMQRGYSRDHRPDCKQVVIALIVNAEGFPLSYETFDGNRSDVTTLEAVLRMVERKYGKARRIWVFDRGMVSEENLAALRRRGGQYLVGTPRAKLKQFEKALLEGGWERVRADVEVKLVPMPEGEETYILCRSRARQAKEQAIRSRFSQRMEKALAALEKRVAEGKLKDPSKIERSLGRIQARHPQVADLYRMNVVEINGAWRLEWQAMEGRQNWQRTREGAYLLRTNLPPEQPENLWKDYIQLTEAEAAFRALKSELSIRPIFHQLERRAKAHILVAFLGYALWVTLKHLLIRNGSPFSAAKALDLLSTLVSADIILPTIEGREIRLRRVTTPTPKQKKLLSDLGITIPDRLNFDQECSADFQVA
ncbi:MAG TPA: IS1634 family transposase [Woeseiaceae bacterium]|nr:IS1634 family transposase [Woeseiaceae bacterium]